MRNKNLTSVGSGWKDNGPKYIGPMDPTGHKEYFQQNFDSDPVVGYSYPSNLDQSQYPTSPNHGYVNQPSNQVQNPRDVLQNCSYSQMLSHIQNIIATHDHQIEKMKRKREMLVNHLQNLKRLFFQNLSTQKMVGRYKGESFNGQQEGYQEDGLLKQEDETMFDRGYERKKKYQDLEMSRAISAKYDEKQMERSYGVSNRREKRNRERKSHIYGYENWQQEQRRIMNFLNHYLRKKIVSTPKQVRNTIEKALIFLLYNSWCKAQKYEKNTGLKNNETQQILTNEMRVMFSCETNQKDYVGIAFVKKAVREESGSGEGEEVSNEQREQVNNEQREHKISAQRGPTINANLKTGNVEREDQIQEEFSVDFEQDNNGDDNSYLYA